MILDFERPERFCIVDNNGSIVRLNDRNKTEMRFHGRSELPRARRLLNALNGYHARCLSVANRRGPYRLLPLIEQESRT